jgi:hypothetical protein
MVGGDPAVFERVKPLFELMGRNITLVGGNGDGQTAKVANQIIVALNIALLAAIFRFADVSLVATWLLVPYWLWALFATTLNAAMAVLAR